jgi:hypothetical protein
MLVLDRTLSPSRSAGLFDDADESCRPRPRPRRMRSRSASPDRFLNLHTEYRQTAFSLIPGRAHWSRLCKSCKSQLATTGFAGTSLCSAAATRERRGGRPCWGFELRELPSAPIRWRSTRSNQWPQKGFDGFDAFDAVDACGRHGLFWNFFAPSEWPPRAARRVRKWLCQSSQRGRARI